MHDASIKEKEVSFTGNGIPVARIAVSEQNYDFKIVKNGTTKDYDFEIENYGTADLVLQNFNFIGMGSALFTVSAGGAAPITVTPGTKHTITVQFAPVADGQYNSTLQIHHTAINENSPYEITIAGEGMTATPEIDVNISSPWDMGEKNIGSSKSMDFEISNNGNSALTVTSIILQTSTDFGFVEIQDKNNVVLNFPVLVAVSDYVVAVIEFKPTVKGTLNDKIQIVHDGINQPTPFEIDVEGVGKGVASYTTPGNFNWTVPAGVTTVKVLVVGGGGGGSGSHYGGGGSGWVVVRDVNVSPGNNIPITVGAGGAGGIIGTNSSPGGHGTDSKFGTTVTATGGKGGGGGGAGYYGGGDGGSGGGGAGNMGFAGKGGSAGSNGDPGASYPGGIGGHFDSLSGFTGNLTAGAGGAAGTSSNAGGGGAGGVQYNSGGPDGGDGGQSWSGKGGKGYGAGGGSGGYSSGSRPGGGKGADGFVYFEY